MNNSGRLYIVQGRKNLVMASKNFKLKLIKWWWVPFSSSNKKRCFVDCVMHDSQFWNGYLTRGWNHFFAGLKIAMEGNWTCLSKMWFFFFTVQHKGSNKAILFHLFSSSLMGLRTCVLWQEISQTSKCEALKFYSWRMSPWTQSDPRFHAHECVAE